MLLKCTDQQLPASTDIISDTYKQQKLQHDVPTAIPSNNVGIPSKPLPTVSSVLLLGRKKQSCPHKRTESSSIKTYFKAASCQTSNPVASSTAPKITRTLQQSFQPQAHVTTPSNTVQIKRTCPHVQSFQPPSDTALHATEMNVYHEALTGSTIQEVPTTSISKEKSSEKEPTHSHTKLPSVTSILLLNTKKKNEFTGKSVHP